MPELTSLLKSGPKNSLKKAARNALIAACAAALISLLLPNRYLSSACLLPLESQGSNRLGNLAAAAMAFGVGIGGGGDANFVDILNSRWVGEGLLNSEFQFNEQSWCFGATVTRKMTLYQYLDQKNADRALRALRGCYAASKDMKTNMIQVSAETRSPELSQQIVVRAIVLLNQFQVQRARTRGSENAL